MMDFLPVAAFFGIAFEPFPACVPMPRPVCRDEAHGHDRHVHQPARRFLECHPLSGQHGQQRYRLHWLLKPVDEAHHGQRANSVAPDAGFGKAVELDAPRSAAEPFFSSRRLFQKKPERIWDLPDFPRSFLPESARDDAAF